MNNNTPAYELDVSGDINYTGTLFKDGVDILATLSGDYNDLDNLPTLFDNDYISLDNKLTSGDNIEISANNVISATIPSIPTETDVQALIDNTATSSSFTDNGTNIQYKNIQIHDSEIRVVIPDVNALPQGYIYEPMIINTSLSLTNTDIDPIVSSTALTVSFNASYDVTNKLNILCIEFDETTSLSIIKDDQFTAVTVSDIDLTTTPLEYPSFSLLNATGTNPSYTHSLFNQPHCNGEYVFGASTEFSTDLSAKFAFNKLTVQSQASTEYWLSANIYNTDGTYNGSKTRTYNTTETYFGEWIQIKLPESIILKSNQISTKDSANGALRAIRDFILLGSTDGIDWYAIEEYISIIYWGSAGAFKTFTLSNNNTLYSHYRIAI